MYLNAFKILSCWLICMVGFCQGKEEEDVAAFTRLEKGNSTNNSTTENKTLTINVKPIAIDIPESTALSSEVNDKSENIVKISSDGKGDHKIPISLHQDVHSRHSNLMNYRLFEKAGPMAVGEHHYVIIHPDSRQADVQVDAPNTNGLYKYYAGYYWPPHYGDIASYLTDSELRTIQDSDNLFGIKGSFNLGGGGVGGGGGSFHSQGELSTEVTGPTSSQSKVHGSVSGTYSGGAAVHGATYAMFIGAQDNDINKDLDNKTKIDNQNKIKKPTDVHSERPLKHNNSGEKTAHILTENVVDNKPHQNVYYPNQQSQILMDDLQNLDSSQVQNAVQLNAQSDNGEKGIYYSHLLEYHKNRNENNSNINNHFTHPPLDLSSINQNVNSAQFNTHKIFLSHRPFQSQGGSTTIIQGGFGAGANLQGGAQYQNSNNLNQQGVPASNNAQGGFGVSGNVQGGGYYHHAQNNNQGASSTTIQGGYGASGNLQGGGNYQQQIQTNPVSSTTNSHGGFGASGHVQGGGYYQHYNPSIQTSTSTAQGSFGASGNVQGGGYYQQAQTVPPITTSSNIQGGFGASGNIQGGGYYQQSQSLNQGSPATNVQGGYGTSTNLQSNFNQGIPTNNNHGGFSGSGGIQGTGHYQQSQSSNQGSFGLSTQGGFGTSGNVQGGGYYQQTQTPTFGQSVNQGNAPTNNNYPPNQGNSQNVQGGFATSGNVQGSGYYQQAPNQGVTDLNSQGSFAESGNVQGSGHYQQTQNPTFGQSVNQGNVPTNNYPPNQGNSQNVQGGFGTSGNVQGSGYYQQAPNQGATDSNSQGSFVASGNVQGGGYYQQQTINQGQKPANAQGGFSSSGNVQGGGYQQSQNSNQATNTQGGFNAAGSIQGGGYYQQGQNFIQAPSSPSAQGGFGTAGNFQGNGFYQQTQNSNQPSSTLETQGGFVTSGNVQGSGHYQQGQNYNQGQPTAGGQGGFSTSGNSQGSGFYQPAQTLNQGSTTNNVQGGFGTSGNVQGSGYYQQSQQTTQINNSQGGIIAPGENAGAPNSSETPQGSEMFQKPEVISQGGNLKPSITPQNELQPSLGSNLEQIGPAGNAQGSFSGSGNVQGSGVHELASSNQSNNVQGGFTTSGNVQGNGFYQQGQNPPQSSLNTNNGQGNFVTSGNVQGGSQWQNQGQAPSNNNQGGFETSGSVQGGGYYQQTQSPNQGVSSQGGFASSGSVQGSGNYQNVNTPQSQENTFYPPCTYPQPPNQQNNQQYQNNVGSQVHIKPSSPSPSHQISNHQHNHHHPQHNLHQQNANKPIGFQKPSSPYHQNNRYFHTLSNEPITHQLQSPHYLRATAVPQFITASDINYYQPQNPIFKQPPQARYAPVVKVFKRDFSENKTDNKENDSPYQVHKSEMSDPEIKELASYSDHSTSQQGNPDLSSNSAVKSRFLASTLKNKSEQNNEDYTDKKQANKEIHVDTVNIKQKKV